MKKEGLLVVKGKCPNRRWDPQRVLHPSRNPPCGGDLMLNYKGKQNQVKCIKCSGWFTITPAVYREWLKEAQAQS